MEIQEVCSARAAKSRINAMILQPLSTITTRDVVDSANELHWIPIQSGKNSTIARIPERCQPPGIAQAKAPLSAIASGRDSSTGTHRRSVIGGPRSGPHEVGTSGSTSWGSRRMIGASVRLATCRTSKSRTPGGHRANERHAGQAGRERRDRCANRCGPVRATMPKPRADEAAHTPRANEPGAPRDPGHQLLARRGEIEKSARDEGEQGSGQGLHRTIVGYRSNTYRCETFAFITHACASPAGHCAPHVRCLN